MLKYDVRQGILKKWYYYLFFTGLLLFFIVQSYMRLRITIYAPSCVDVLLYLFRGIPEYIPDPNDIKLLQMPMEYLIMAAAMWLFTASYARKEWEERGKVQIIRYKNKNSWWFSKCVWSMVSMVLLHLCIFGAAWIVAACGGNAGLHCSEGIELAFDEGFLLTTSRKEIAGFLLVAVAMMIAFSQLQLVLQMVLFPVAALAIPLAVWIISVYQFRSWLPGNYLLFYRTTLFLEDGVHWGYGLLLAGIVWLISVVGGLWLVNRKDIL